ncbi:MAG: phage terminase large subunit family protein [Alphaproteobacteria bacterium]|nr:MAG: phage terminase large subunit family protein [Alphaproteobacteria bacterium]
MDALQECLAHAALALRPDPRLSVSEWADAHRHLSQTASGEPGPWRTERTPYLKEIMDCLSPSCPVEKIVMMKGAQTGGTEAGNNWIGYVMHHAPGPMLAVQPTVEMAKRWSKQRVASLIDGTPVLRERVKEARSRDSGNTVQSKEFPGGILVMTGANSAVGLRSMPVRYLFLDEVDAYDFDVDGEGDPVSLASQRTITFANRKIFLVSTPTIQGLSRIELEYEQSDRRRWWVPCPECGAYQVLEEKRLQWPKDRPEEAAYFCVHCNAAIPSHRKAWMNARGQWRADAPGVGKAAGFHLSGLNSPWLTWAQIAERKIAAKDDAAMKVYVNTIEARTWTESGEAPEWQRLYDRREDYRLGTVPMGGLFLTAGVDVQDDRLEIEIAAWGRDRECWSVDYRVLTGCPAHADVWDKLDFILGEGFKHDSGAWLSIAKLAIDTGGHYTPEVYDWARRKKNDRIMAIKGMRGLGAALGLPGKTDVTMGGKRKRRGLLVWPVGASFCKTELYGNLRKDRPTDGRIEAGEPYPPGFCHFPKYDEEYFKQLTAERLVTVKDKNGFPRREWRKMRERNEALDCRVYARAAAAQIGIDQFGERRWRELERQVGVNMQESETASAPPSERIAGVLRRKMPSRRKTFRSSYLS